MKNAAAFRASYADWRLIKTRNVIQLIFEIPLEDHDQAYQALGGMPDQSTARWFAIARLTDGASAPAPREAESGLAESNRSASRTASPARPASLAQQAAICCGNPVFWKFLSENFYVVQSKDEAAACIRTHCGVESRSEIKPENIAGGIWRVLHGRYLIWRDNPELVPDHHERMDCQGERA